MNDAERLGLISAGETVTLTPLTGGVSSEIVKVEAPGRTFVVKRALPKLRVAEDWQAPVSRNRHEADWLEVANAVVPGAAPAVLARDDAAGLFAMPYLGYPVWKEQLRDGVVDLAFAESVGRTLVTIHGKTSGDARIAARFATDDVFRAIRLEPYFEATARKHPDLAEALGALSVRTLATHLALVHGDVSPKNILVRASGPVFLDAECAWYGDPAFDLAFCLNHLLLKRLWAREAADRLMEAFRALAAAYLSCVTWESHESLERRAASLLPALMLARVDGKSPVEYLGEAERDSVRRLAIPLIRTPPDSLMVWGACP